MHTPPTEDLLVYFLLPLPSPLEIPVFFMWPMRPLLLYKSNDLLWRGGGMDIFWLPFVLGGCTVPLMAFNFNNNALLSCSFLMTFRIEDQAFLKEIRKSAITPRQPSKIPSANQALKILALLTEKVLSTNCGEPHSNLVTDGFLSIFKPQQPSLTHHD